MGGTSSASTTPSVLKLDPALTQAVCLEAKRLKKSPQAVLRAAVNAYLEELEDCRDVMKRKGEKPIPFDKVKKELGLDG
jgi:hypothetical protein